MEFNAKNFSGGSRGGLPPLFLDQTEAQRAEKKFFWDCPLPYLRVWMTTPPPLPEGLDLNLYVDMETFKG